MTLFGNNRYNDIPDAHGMLFEFTIIETFITGASREND